MSDPFLPSPPYGLQRQLQVYRAGLEGQRPALPVDPAALEAAAQVAMSPEARGYLSGMPDTMAANLEAFRRWRIVPRMLRDVAQRDLSVTLFGHRYPAPFLLAPIGVQSVVHPDAEPAVARAAAAAGVPFILSTVSSAPMDRIVAEMGGSPRWFQLYWSKNEEFNAAILNRAEKAGCDAIVVTLDTPLLSWRAQDIQNAYLPFLQGMGLGNYVSEPAFRTALPQPPEADLRSAIEYFLRIFGNPSLAWEDLARARHWTRLPIVLKGVLHPDDARRALQAGMDGIIVSNHGGRQVEGAIATLDALVPVAEAVGGRIPVVLDSGIRRAADIIKARALGADAVLLGRPYMWALALGGEGGVHELLRNVLADLDLTLALSGYRAFRDVGPSAVIQAP